MSGKINRIIFKSIPFKSEENEAPTIELFGCINKDNFSGNELFPNTFEMQCVLTIPSKDYRPMFSFGCYFEETIVMQHIKERLHEMEDRLIIAIRTEISYISEPYLNKIHEFFIKAKENIIDFYSGVSNE